MNHTITSTIAAAMLLTTTGPLSADPAGVEFFEKRIRPLLAEHCIACHGPTKQRSGLMLSSPAALLKGGDRGPAVLPANGEQSLLLRAVRYTDDELRMPPKGKLKDDQLADLAAWVKMGAPVPRADSTLQAAAGSDFNLAERRRYWAYQPVRAEMPPPVAQASWCTAPIDRFLLARLEAAGLAPAGPADQHTLIRRVTFDLTGLPPTPAEVEAFLADAAPDAYEKLVERLLASPHYGERWARHWLDLVRFAETLAYEFDFDVYNAWRYRDYVIRAFNADLPYNQFVVEHLAGDLLPEPRRHPQEGFNESILGTGFFLFGEGKQTPVDIRQEQADRIDNQIDVLGKAFLGQTLACARCHDHKFDAISTRDYYALAGYLKSSRTQQAFLDPPGRITAKARELAARKARIRALAATEQVPVWRGELERTARYLLAARRVLTDEASQGASLEQVAREFDLDAVRLERWIKALELKQVDSVEHPFHAWVGLAGRDEMGTSFGQRRQHLREALEEPRALAQRAAHESELFDRFRRPSHDGWYVSGDAFGPGPARPGDIILGEKPDRPIARLASGGVHSALVSERLQGEMRSRTFTLDKPYIHFRMAGRRARVNLVIDGYTLIMKPLYGDLTIEAQEEQPVWRTMDVQLWKGHRAHVELRDSTIPMHNLQPPPSDGREPRDPDGFIVVEEIRLSDDASPPPASPHRLNLETLARTEKGDVETLARAYQDLLLRDLERWRSGTTRPADGHDAVTALDWLLRTGLLDGPAPAALTREVEEYRRQEATLPHPLRAPALADGTGEDEYVFLRGNHRTLGARAPRGLPEVLAGRDQSPAGANSGRLELAQRLAQPSNPLLARVLVNRLWQHHFGEGLVRTPDDFGRMGQAPTHPELLDYLAAEFMRHGWSMKHLHRLLVLSSAYRMSSRAASDADCLDPENRLLHRMPIRRLEAEAIRDALLAVSGRLDATLYGPGVSPYLTPYMEGRGRPKPGPLDGDGRRSIYLNVRRNFLTPLLLAFDYPVTFSTLGRRGVSTVPAQALTLMNDPFVVQQARHWSERLLAEPGLPAEVRIHALYQAAFARPPSAEEQQTALSFLERQAARFEAGLDDPRPWAELCHVLINVKEFIFVK